MLAGVSVNRAVSVLNELVRLGLARRRDVGRSALVSLDRENEAGRLIVALTDVRDAVLRRLRQGARGIRPAPASIVAFGSFAAGTATRDSDVDVLAVRAKDVPEDNGEWLDSLGHWVDRAARITGNPVNLLLVGESELPGLLDRRGSVWGEMAENGIVLAGSALQDLASVA